MENGHFPCLIILGVFCFFGPTEINLLDLVIPKKKTGNIFILGLVVRMQMQMTGKYDCYVDKMTKVDFRLI